MRIEDFKLEVFFGKYEFSAKYLLAQSDCQTMSVSEILALESGAREEFLNSGLGYTPVPGTQQLREQISRLYSSLNTRNILVHAGAQEAIFNFMNVFLNEGDHMITQFPVYQSIYSIAQSLGCDVSRWNLIQTDTGWSMDLNELEALIRPNTKLICINNPNNPTGFIFSRREMEQIAAIANRQGVFVFCDEVYKGLELDGEKRPWFADISENSLSLGVMSKAYGLAGLRIGWIGTKDERLIEKMEKMKHYTSICNSCTSEILATIALSHSDEILEKNMALIQKNLLASDRFFKKFDHIFKYNPPVAGSVAFHRLNTGEPIADFCKQLVEKSGVLLLPADVYDYPHNYFRMGYGRSDYIQNLEILEDYLVK